MGLISTKLRSSARGMQCAFQIPGVCNGDPETTVLCHAPSEIKGIGNKGDDYHAAFGCHSCHEALDHHRLPEKWHEYYYWLRGIMRTQNHWVQSGLMILPVDPATAKRRPKKPSNIKSRDLSSQFKRRMNGDIIDKSTGEIVKEGRRA